MRRLHALTSYVVLAGAACVADGATAQAPRILAFDAVTTVERAQSSKSAQSALALRVAGAPREFDLQLDDNHRLIERVGPAARERGLRVMAGGIRNVAGSWVRLTRIDGRWSGAIHDGTRLWLLDPVERVADLLAVVPRAGVRSVLYRAADVRWPDRIDRVALAGITMPTPAASKGSGPERELDLALYADPQYTAIHGSNAMAFALARANVADGIFAAQAGVRITVSLYTPLADGALPTHNFADVLLFRFGERVNGPPAQPKGDLTHLLTGRDVCLWDMMAGCVPGTLSIAGIANQLDSPGGPQGVLCHPTEAYSLSEAHSGATVFALITAHELGHNFGAPHDREAGSACEATPPGNWLMNPALDDNDGTLSPCSLTTIADDIAGASCLRMLEPPLFANGFES